ncbi:MAG: phenazine biosynthesis protein PhzF family [Solirubrobacterales bacterium]|nr:phenazine biosynthesis protein PhzF family [Solirubrobacterales bacterium]
MSEVLQRLVAFDPFAAREGRGARSTRPYVLMDVFTDVPLEGNQLAVLTDASDVPEEEMQRLARELNLSETVFVLPPRQQGDVRIRIFTPAAELPFAGHPVLGCAIVVAGALGLGSVTLETEGGAVSIEVRQLGERVAFGRMRQPTPSWRSYDRETELLAALGVARSGLPVEIYDNGPRHVYVELGSEQEVARLDPDMRALGELGEVCVSCFAGSGTRWKTRMFAPALGVAEDPATGSAAGPLAVHLSRHGRIAFGEEIEIRQGAEIQRPSMLYARADGSGASVERVEVGGAAVIVGRGELLPRH